MISPMTQTINSDSIIESWLIRIMSNKPNPEFHRITLKTDLDDTENYYRISNWKFCSENKSKAFENELSMHRRYKIRAYPNGIVFIHISASNQPFGWLDRN